MCSGRIKAHVPRQCLPGVVSQCLLQKHAGVPAYMPGIQPSLGVSPQIAQIVISAIKIKSFRIQLLHLQQQIGGIILKIGRAHV